jgi:4-aminobutyrate aminotransferase/(S)-3-amino-2-methylpropionate transaminase
LTVKRGDVLRFLPPLVMPEHLLDEAPRVLEEVTLSLL